MVRGRLAAVVAVLGLVAAGCWSLPGQGPGRAGWNQFEQEITAATVSSLAVASTHPGTGPAHEALISEGDAYVTQGSSLSAFDLTSGTTLWTSAAFTPDPILVGERLRQPAGGLICDIFDIDRSTGNLDLTFETTFGPALASPCVAGPALGTGGEVFLAWSAVRPASAVACGPQSGWFAETGVDAIALSGVQWQHVGSSTLVCGAKPPAGPLAFGPLTAVGALIVGAGATPGATSVEALRAVDGTSAWVTDVGAAVNHPVLTTSTGDIALTTDDGRLVVLDGLTGAELWSASVSSTLPAAATSTSIFVVSPTGTLAVFAAAGCGAATCTPEWTATTASPASARPSIGADVVYVGSADGSVTAFPAEGCGSGTCASLWSGATGTEVTGAPAIAGGRVVVGSASGAVTVFALP